MLFLLLQILVFTVAVFYPLYLLRRRKRNALRYPPGPRPLPLLGNMTDMPDEREWETYAKWPSAFGDLTYLSIFGRDMIFVNTEKAVKELLEKRAENTAGRFESTWSSMIGEDWLLSMMNGEPHRERRALVQKHFIGRVHSYREIQTQEAHRFLRRLLSTPENFFEEIQLVAARVVMLIGYGHAPAAMDDPFLVMLEDVLRASSASYPIVDALPFLAHYPEWLPLSGFRRLARKIRVDFGRMRDLPFQISKTQLADGTAIPSFVTTLLGQLTPEAGNAREEELIRDAAGVMYGAGADTTKASLWSFLAAMVMEPEVQKRAQDEIDRVVGTDRLPSFADRDSLPFVDAVVKETLRWNCALPIGIPHTLLNEDSYEGYYLPKGAMIIGNVWAILHDPTLFPDPDRFNPEHFLGEAKEVARSRVDWAFGFGRRACPGRYLAEATIYIVVVSILATFDVSKLVWENSNQEPLEVEFTSGFIRRPLRFECAFTPRSAKTASLIRETDLDT